jgi:hypothetical protein
VVLADNLGALALSDRVETAEGLTQGLTQGLTEGLTHLIDLVTTDLGMYRSQG